MIRNFLLSAVAVAMLSGPAWADEVLTASGTGDLYLVDPAAGEARHLGRTAQFFDIAQMPDGRIIGVTGRGAVAEIDVETGRIAQIGSTGTFVNALVAAPDGRLIGAGENKIFEIDAATGRARRLMSLTGFDSSGDLAYGPDGALYATGLARGGSDGDILIRLDLEARTGEQVGRGIGLSNVYCLALSDAGLLGITETGQMVLISVSSGAGKPLGPVGRGASCYGAATLWKPLGLTS